MSSSDNDGATPTTASEPDHSDAIKELLQCVAESNEEVVSRNNCSGTYALSESTGGLAYRKAADSVNAGWLDFAKPVEEHELAELVKACDQATFGRGNEDVLDLSYRQAWKLDTSRFLAQFDVVKSGLLDVVHDELLPPDNTSLKIDAQLYKLNVYGPGSHFKSHLDTPRSDKMFGSLVIIFPTVHAGGDLTLRSQEGASWTFESSKLVASNTTDNAEAPRNLAWVAFYSDIEHEVSVVESGYRVSLTYNLYYAEDSAPTLPNLVMQSATPEEAKLRNSIKNLLASPFVLPSGGALGFGLSYKYPIGMSTDDVDFEPITGHLKGKDALVKRICDSFGLECHVRGLYDTSNYFEHESDSESEGDELLTNGAYLAEKTIYVGAPSSYEDDMVKALNRGGNLRILDPFMPLQPQIDRKPECDWWAKGPARPVAVLWATPANSLVAVPSPALAYGNEHDVGWYYADLVLVALVPPYEERLANVGNDA